MTWIESSGDPFELQFSVSTLETAAAKNWRNLSPEDQKQTIGALQHLLSTRRAQVPIYVSGKAVKALLEVARQAWPHQYPTFLDEVGELVQHPEPAVTVLGLQLLDGVVQEFLVASEWRSQAHATRARQRELRGRVVQALPDIISVLMGLISSRMDANGDTSAEQHHVVLKALETMASVIESAPLGEHIEPHVPSTLFAIARRPLQPDVRDDGEAWERAAAAAAAITALLDKPRVPPDWTHFVGSMMEGVSSLIADMCEALQDPVVREDPELASDFVSHLMNSTSVFCKRQLVRATVQELPVDGFLEALLRATASMAHPAGLQSILSGWSHLVSLLRDPAHPLGKSSARLVPGVAELTHTLLSKAMSVPTDIADASRVEHGAGRVMGRRGGSDGDFPSEIAEMMLSREEERERAALRGEGLPSSAGIEGEQDDPLPWAWQCVPPSGDAEESASSLVPLLNRLLTVPTVGSFLLSRVLERVGVVKERLLKEFGAPDGPGYALQLTVLFSIMPSLAVDTLGAVSAAHDSSDDTCLQARAALRQMTEVLAETARIAREFRWHALGHRMLRLQLAALEALPSMCPWIVWEMSRSQQGSPAAFSSPEDVLGALAETALHAFDDGISALPEPVIDGGFRLLKALVLDSGALAAHLPAIPAVARMLRDPVTATSPLSPMTRRGVLFLLIRLKLDVAHRDDTSGTAGVLGVRELLAPFVTACAELGASLETSVAERDIVRALTSVVQLGKARVVRGFEALELGSLAIGGISREARQEWLGLILPFLGLAQNLVWVSSRLLAALSKGARPPRGFAFGAATSIMTSAASFLHRLFDRLPEAHGEALSLPVVTETAPLLRDALRHTMGPRLGGSSPALLRTYLRLLGSVLRGTRRLGLETLNGFLDLCTGDIAEACRSVDEEDRDSAASSEVYEATTAWMCVVQGIVSLQTESLFEVTRTTAHPERATVSPADPSSAIVIRVLELLVGSLTASANLSVERAALSLILSLCDLPSVRRILSATNQLIPLAGELLRLSMEREGEQLTDVVAVAGRLVEDEPEPLWRELVTRFFTASEGMDDGRKEELWMVNLQTIQRRLSRSVFQYVENLAISAQECEEGRTDGYEGRVVLQTLIERMQGV